MSKKFLDRAYPKFGITERKALYLQTFINKVGGNFFEMLIRDKNISDVDRAATKCEELKYIHFIKNKNNVVNAIKNKEISRTITEINNEINGLTGLINEIKKLIKWKLMRNMTEKCSRLMNYINVIIVENLVILEKNVDHVSLM